MPDPRRPRAATTRPIRPARRRSMTDSLEEVLEERAAEDLGDARATTSSPAIEEMVAHPGVSRAWAHDRCSVVTPPALVVLDDLADTSPGGTLDTLGGALAQYADEVDAEGDLVSFVACFREPVPVDERRGSRRCCGEHCSTCTTTTTPRGPTASRPTPTTPTSRSASPARRSSSSGCTPTHPGSLDAPRCRPSCSTCTGSSSGCGSDGRYQRMRDTIRRRDTELQGFPNPMVSDHGETSEARQGTPVARYRPTGPHPSRPTRDSVATQEGPDAELSDATVTSGRAEHR